MLVSSLTPEPSPARYQVRRASLASSGLDWDAAACLMAFDFPWEATPVPSTEFRALWDDTHLHFRFDCVDHDLVLGAGETLKDRVLGSDRVEIFLTPDLNLTPYYGFEMSPRGNGEALVYSARFYREYDWGWTCPELSLSAAIEGTRYHVQGSLPLDTLRALDVLKPGATQFYAGVFRAEFSHQPDGGVHSGWMAWVDPKTERPDFHVPSAFGVFELVG